MASALVDRFGGEVPTDLEDLVTIPGVGRKTGNVVRSVAFGFPGLPVDTHVLRVSERLHLTEALPAPARKDAVKVELELNGFIPAPERGAFSLRVILHGRRRVLPGNPAVTHVPWRITALRYGKRRDAGRIRRPFWQFVVLKVKSENPSATIVSGTGSRHLVPKGSFLGSASRTTRPMPAFGPALVFPDQVGPGGAGWRRCGNTSGATLGAW